MIRSLSRTDRKGRLVFLPHLASFRDHRPAVRIPCRRDARGRLPHTVEKTVCDFGCQLGCQRVLKLRNLAGMDGNRIHPGRLNSAPQTVLKTAFLTSASVQLRPLKIEIKKSESADVRRRLPTSDRMAVSSAVRMFPAVFLSGVYRACEAHE